jgi:acetolactate synthase-1/2/3 large subunit
MQNSDFVLSIGSRLDTHATGTPLNSWARDAKKVVVELDTAELKKFELQGLHIDIPIGADVADFLKALYRRIDDVHIQDISEWHGWIAKWRKNFPVCPPEFKKQTGSVNPYVFLDALSDVTADDDVLIPDCGGNLIQTFQGYRLSGNQKMFSAFNNSPMGYSLAGSIGACFGSGRKRIICIIGDGGLQLNIQELGTVARHRLPIKIFLFNNHGYGIIQQTQDDWLESRYWASRPETGLADPNYVNIAKAYGIETMTIKSHRDIRSKIKKALDIEGPVMCNLEFSQDQRIFPMLKAGRPIEDANPLLDRKKFAANMVTKPLDISLKS